MSEHPVVGPLFSPHLLEEALIKKLREWLPGYLNLACQINGVGGIAAIKSWGLASTDDRWPEQGLPALLVVCDGTMGDPEKSGGGMYRATWSCEVGIAFAAATGPAARRCVQVYGAAVRGALLQGRSLGDGLLVKDWLGESPPGTVKSEQRRTTVASANAFAVQQDNVVSWRKGPGSDKPPIPDDWPVVEETDVEMEIEE